MTFILNHVSGCLFSKGHIVIILSMSITKKLKNNRKLLYLKLTLDNDVEMNDWEHTLILTSIELFLKNVTIFYKPELRNEVGVMNNFGD